MVMSLRRKIISFRQAIRIWFKNNKPFQDHAVFKLERKLSIQNVFGKMRSAELHEMVMEKDGGIEKGDIGYPGLYQLALSEYLKKMSDEE